MYVRYYTYTIYIVCILLYMLINSGQFNLDDQSESVQKDIENGQSNSRG